MASPFPNRLDGPAKETWNGESAIHSPRRLFVIMATQGRIFSKRTKAEPFATSGGCQSSSRLFNQLPSWRPDTAGRDGPKWHSHVEIERERYKEIRDNLLHLAVHRSANRFALEFYRLPFEPYAADSTANAQSAPGSKSRSESSGLRSSALRGAATSQASRATVRSRGDGR